MELRLVHHEPPDGRPAGRRLELHAFEGEAETIAQLANHHDLVFCGSHDVSLPLLVDLAVTSNCWLHDGGDMDESASSTVKTHHDEKAMRMAMTNDGPGSMTTATSPGERRRRALRATAVGNVVEWYDFGLYGAFANIIAVTYFPGDAQARSLAVFAAFGVAFLARPAGAVLFGHLGDRYGRRNALATTILVTSTATAMIGLLPGFDAIGWAAPVLLAVLRIALGMAVGGAYGGATAFIVEHAPLSRRGLYGGVQWSTMALGLALGASTGALLTHVMPTAALESWGWRLAFVAALPLGCTSLYIRLRTHETPAFEALVTAGGPSPSPVRETLRVAPRELIVGLGLVAAISCAVNFFFVFLPSHLSRAGGMTGSEALTACVAGLLVVALLAPAAGSLSDRAGRRPVVMSGVGVLLLAVVPACWSADQMGVVGLVIAYLSVGVGLGLAAPSTFLAELFPTRLRFSGLSLTYGVGSAIVGGFTPLLATALLAAGGSVLPVAWWMVALFLVGLLCLVLARETVPAGGGPDDQ
jgi:MFS transporter, MHS family, proline/betaine transporter